MVALPELPARGRVSLFTDRAVATPREPAARSKARSARAKWLYTARAPNGRGEIEAWSEAYLPLEQKTEDQRRFRTELRDRLRHLSLRCQDAQPTSQRASKAGSRQAGLIR